ncbi:MAG: 3'-5' exonuclease domain-containing protein 2 [Bacteroidales bacterium]|nr:3'-5' exonuclease domain-containing protein 2 [Bacteroidales bacterium]MCF8334062.1 3'-5' exonuclease domain-containing protein 2 [Bacteroidales bacterium]
MGREITKEEVNQLKRDGFNGEIVVVEEQKDAADICREVLIEEDLLGFDTETRPAFTKGEKHQPALIQIACAETVYLFRINKTGLIQPITDILGNEDIIKAGIAIGRDLEELQELRYFEPAGFVDLNKMATQKGFQSIGVRNLTAMLLGFRVSKRQQTSNWETEVLKPAQARYAATDAWVCREIYLKLMNL